MIRIDYNYILNLIQENKIDDCHKYIRTIIPQFLYKYYYLYDENSRKNQEENEKRFNTLAENKIWLSKFEAFNDLFESKYEYIDTQKLKKSRYTDADIEMIKKINEGFDQAYVATSFSTHLTDCMPLWAHYSNNYKGYCVKYKVVDSSNIYPVFYEESRVASTITARLTYNFIKRICQKSDEVENAINRDMFLSVLSRCVKHKSWEYEDEFRILICSECNKHSCDDLGLEPIKIYAGFNITPNHLKRLQDISSNLGLGSVSHCKISDNKYELDFE